MPILVTNPKPKALDLFCGAGGATRGLQMAGFEVTGVDINPQPHYIGECFYQADALTFPLQGYDLIWASPPCQLHSTLRNKITRTYEDLIGFIRDRVYGSAEYYVIENVPGAPLLSPVMLCGGMFGLKVFRHRLFESNALLLAPPHSKHDGSTGTHRYPYSPTNGYLQITGTGGNYELEAGKRAMGIDWMQTKGELSESIPPAYAEYLARQIIGTENCP